MFTKRSILIGALTLTAGTTVVFPTSLPDQQPPARSQPPRSYDQEIGSIADSAAGKRSHDIHIPPRSRGPAITLEMNANPTVDFKAYAATVVATLQYLEGYWSETLPATFKTEYKRPARIYAYAPPADLGIPCDGIAPSKGNAQYCIREDTIQWDEQSLLIPLYRDVGDFAAAFVVAHEWSHAMQSRLRLLGKARFTIQEELQADCFAGSWTKWISDRGHLQAGDLREAQLALFKARDPVGTPWFAAGAHGNAQQRTRAFDQGYSSDTAKVCVTR